MKKQDEEAFLKSVLGTSPLKKKNRVEKKIPEHNKTFLKTRHIETKDIKNEKFFSKEIKTKSIFSLEKSSINKRLKKGKIPIDKKIDFHGLTVLDAEELFLDTIVECYNKKLRCILFVTGKGVLKKEKNDNENTRLYYGKIRGSFIMWASKEDVQKYILSVEQASIHYGADGAFFVYLRKKN